MKSAVDLGQMEARVAGAAGRITLTREAALNALSHEMCLEIEAMLLRWRADDQVALVVIDAAGDKAFCAGGDIQEMYETGRAGDFDYGRRFWRDEYRLNHLLAIYPKPVVSLMQGFVMGGGVGLGCHCSHRVVCESTQLALPEVAIGLVPDIGSSALLAAAPGALGPYLGLTAARVGPGDGILAGLADVFVPRAGWPDLLAGLEAGLVSSVAEAARPAPEAPLAAARAWIDPAFGAADLGAIADALAGMEGAGPARALKALRRNSPLAMACGLRLIRDGAGGDMAQALRREYRFTHRAMEHGDFLEGIRAAVIDKDRAPRWRHSGPGAVPPQAVARMLDPLGAEELSFSRL